MNPVITYLTFRQLQRSQWLDRDSLRWLQEQKLRQLVDHAYHTVPYYRKRFDESGITPEEIRSLDDLPGIPLTSKLDLQAAGPEAITSSVYLPHTIVSAQTSGSTGRPFMISLDPHFVRVRNGLFLRALMTVGYRLGRKLLLVTSGQEKPSRRWLRWRYASIEDPPERVLTKLNHFRPWALYSAMTPLCQLARYVNESGVAFHRPKVLISTAETLDRATRRFLEETFDAEVYDIYGLTEMGLVGCECPYHTGYHLAEDTKIVELLPVAGGGEASCVVVTNLELKATPVIRFQTGDLAVAGPTAPCACGRTLARLKRVEGRLIDCIQLPDGRSVSPYRLTLKFEQIPGVRRYQVIQEDFGLFTVRLEEGESAGGGGTVQAAQQAIRSIVGRDARVRVQIERNLDPPPGQKFCVVECRLSARGPQ